MESYQAWQIVGHKRAVSLLQRSLERGTLAHAYLLVGPPHVGKMTLALNLAKALNCEANERPCGKCPACQRIASAKYSDVQVIRVLDANSTDVKSRTEIGTEQIKDMLHSASLPPFEGRYKVFIIDGADQLSNEAANRLLKTLEEPAGNVVFILLTTNESLLPVTVISRCQRLDLTRLPIAEIEATLANTWNLEPQKAKLLARLSYGCLGWAISAALDDSPLQQRGEKLSNLIEIINADYEERFTYAARLATQFSQSRGLVQETLDLWLECWHDLLLVKMGNDNAVTNLDRLVSLTEMAKDHSLTEIVNVINSIQATGKRLKQNANPKLALETLMLDIPVRRETRKNLSTSLR